MVLGPLLIGFYPLTKLMNPIWGVLFGFPLHLATEAHGPHPIGESLALLLWPGVVIVLMVWTAGKVLEWRSPWRRRVVLLWIASAFAIVPAPLAPRLFAGWPLLIVTM